MFTDEFSGTDEQEGIIAYHAGTDALYGIGIQFTAIAGIDTPVVATPLSCFSCFLNFAISVTPTAAGFDFVPGGPINAFELVGDPGGIIPGEDILLTGTFLGSGDLDDTVGFTSASVGTDFKHPDIVERWFGPGAEPPPLNFIFLFTSQGFGPNAPPLPFLPAAAFPLDFPHLANGAPLPGGFPALGTYTQWYDVTNADITNFVPEPGTVTLVFLGIVGLLARRRS